MHALYGKLLEFKCYKVSAQLKTISLALANLSSEKLCRLLMIEWTVIAAVQPVEFFLAILQRNCLTIVGEDKLKIISSIVEKRSYCVMMMVLGHDLHVERSPVGTECDEPRELKSP